MSRARFEQAWVYRFVLESQEGKEISSEVAEELLDQIIAWVEERKLQIGGGFRAQAKEEANPEPFPFREG